MNVEIDEFSKMDMQHKQLGEIVKAVCQVLNNGQGPIEFSGNLNRLVEFTRFHFIEEEDFMRCHTYEGLESHKRIHEMLLKKLVELREKTFIFDEKSKARMLSFLEKDFSYHFVEDKHAWKNLQLRKGLV